MLELKRASEECFHFLSEDTHLFETVIALIISTGIIYLLNLPVVYKALVLACRKEYNLFNRSIKNAEKGLLALQIIAIVGTLYSFWISSSITDLITSSFLVLSAQIGIHFVNDVLGCLLTTVLFGFLSCSLVHDLLVSDVPMDGVLAMLTLFRWTIVYAITPYFMVMKYNYCFNKMYSIKSAELLGIWLYIQVSWAIYEGLTILTFSNIEYKLCPSNRLKAFIPPSIELPGSISISYRPMVTIIVVGLGYAVLQGYVWLELLILSSIRAKKTK